MIQYCSSRRCYQKHEKKLNFSQARHALLFKNASYFHLNYMLYAIMNFSSPPAI